MVELIVGLTFQARISLHGKGDLQSALHLDMDLSVSMTGRARLVNQGVHATSEV